MIAVTLVVSAVADTALPVAFGHDGIIEGENAPPVNFENMEVTVYTYITPYPLEVGGDDAVNLKIRFLDRLTDDTFEEVVYRVEIWKAEQLLARSLFYDSDGVLYIEVRPTATAIQQSLGCAQVTRVQNIRLPSGRFTCTASNAMTATLMSAHGLSLQDRYLTEAGCTTSR